MCTRACYQHMLSPFQLGLNLVRADLPRQDRDHSPPPSPHSCRRTTGFFSWWSARPVESCQLSLSAISDAWPRSLATGRRGCEAPKALHWSPRLSCARPVLCTSPIATLPCCWSSPCRIYAAGGLSESVHGHRLQIQRNYHCHPARLPHSPFGFSTTVWSTLPLMHVTM